MQRGNVEMYQTWCLETYREQGSLQVSYDVEIYIHRCMFWPQVLADPASRAILVEGGGDITACVD